MNTVIEKIKTWPTKEADNLAWEKLARAIVETEDQITDSPPAEVVPGSKEGSLTIIGSGIETVGFSIGDEDLIKSADRVFFCVADPSTVVWIKSLRPDAYDLYVLYNDDKVRYITYMQMTEALLHYVRKGEKVVGIYYGHPGIFVLSTHRAIAVAKREGHKAIMKAGVCALDCLCADLGVDPCHPGMIQHEATDMLIRLRKPDTSLHVVLWQVGLIGEMGYRRKGYINENFSIFIEYLQQFYGADYPVTHYVASRYPTIPPTIEEYKLSELHDPEIQLKITGISTFYIAPKDVKYADPDMAKRLGLIKPGQFIKKPDSPLRIIDKYSPREMKAFKYFRDFKVPKGYSRQENTGAGRFLIELRLNPDLCELYEKDPHAALDKFPELTPRERSLLATRDPGAVQIAAKGILTRSPGNQAFLFELLNKKATAVNLKTFLDGVPKSEIKTALEDWGERMRFDINWRKIPEDINIITRSRLFPWTGVYLSESEQLLLTIVGSLKKNAKSYVYVNDKRVRNFSYEKGVLKWKESHGNPHNGFLRTDTLSGGTRRLIGKIWTNEEKVPSNNNFKAKEVRPGYFHLSQSVGMYKNGSGKLEIRIENSGLFVRLNGQLLKTPYELNRRVLTAEGRDFHLAAPNVSKELNDNLWHPEPENRDSFFGDYTVRYGRRLFKEFTFSEDGLKINDSVISDFKFNHGKLIWDNGPDDFSEGELTFLIDPILLSPVLFGKIYSKAKGDYIKCHGSVPVSEISEERRKNPDFKLPGYAWEYLTEICRLGSQRGGLLLWHKWEKYRFTSLIMNLVLGKIRF